MYFVLFVFVVLLRFASSAPPDQGLARRNHGHVEDVRSRGQADHVQHGRGDILRGDEALALLPPRHLLGRPVLGFGQSKAIRSFAELASETEMCWST